MMEMESHYSNTRWQYNTTRQQKAISFHRIQRKSDHKRKTLPFFVRNTNTAVFKKGKQKNWRMILTNVNLTQSTQKWNFSGCVLFQRSISENSLVAMDFSGQQSRVIENPSEALSVAVEEGLSWRVSHAHKTFSTRGKKQKQFPVL